MTSQINNSTVFETGIQYEEQLISYSIQYNIVQSAPQSTTQSTVVIKSRESYYIDSESENEFYGFDENPYESHLDIEPYFFDTREEDLDDIETCSHCRNSTYYCRNCNTSSFYIEEDFETEMEKNERRYFSDIKNDTESTNDNTSVLLPFVITTGNDDTI